MSNSAYSEDQDSVFKLYWLDGKIETVQGKNIADAFSKAGYGGGAISALDYYEEKR